MADYLEKLKKEYPGMFGPVGSSPIVASHEFATDWYRPGSDERWARRGELGSAPLLDIDPKTGVDILYPEGTIPKVKTGTKGPMPVIEPTLDLETPEIKRPKPYDPLTDHDLLRLMGEEPMIDVSYTPPMFYSPFAEDVPPPAPYEKTSYFDHLGATRPGRLEKMGSVGYPYGEEKGSPVARSLPPLLYKPEVGWERSYYPYDGYGRPHSYASTGDYVYSGLADLMTEYHGVRHDRSEDAAAAKRDAEIAAYWDRVDAYTESTRDYIKSLGITEEEYSKRSTAASPLKSEYVSDHPDYEEIAALMDRVVDLPIAEEVVLDAEHYSKHGTPLAETKEEAFATYPSWIADELATAIESDIGTVVTPMMIGEVLRKGEEPTALSIAEALAIPITSVGAGIIKLISRYKKIKDDLIGEPFDLSKADSFDTGRMDFDIDPVDLHKAYVKGDIVPDFAVADSIWKRIPVFGDTLKAIDARLATSGGTGATIDADKVIADTARSMLGDDSATSIAKIRDIMKAELIKDHPGIGKVGALERYIHGVSKSRMAGFGPTIRDRTIDMDDLLSGYLPEEAATIGGYVEPAIRKAADAATIAKYGSIPDAMKSGAVTGAIGTAAFHGDDFLKSFISTALPAEAPIIPVDDFSSMSIPSSTPSYMEKDAGGMWHDTRSLGYLPPGYDWRTGTFSGEAPGGGGSSASMSDDDRLAAALERMASIPAGFVGGPPKTITHIDATGGPLTPFGGVGDIGGGSGTVTSPLTGVGGFYAPIIPHTGITAPVDPFAELWT